MARVKPIYYQGPEKEFIPDLGNNVQIPRTTKYPPSVAPNQGYADLDYLISLLDGISTVLQNIFDEASFKLKNFALVIDNDTLRQAHDQAYPEDQTPDAISYEEYRYLQLYGTSNAAQYVIASYERSLRNPPGTNALDIANLAFYIQNEISRIKEFIESYVGDLDDTSEYRTIELFQDWATDTAILVENLWKTVKGEVSIGLPQSELDQLDSQTAGQFQSFFQVKLNKINQNISDLIGRLIKNWEEPAEVFYNKYLGPALKFQLNTGRHLQGRISQDTMPILANEIAGSMIGLDANFSSALADQIKRNKIFEQGLSEILLNIRQRDSYFRYISDLSSKGKIVKNRFTNSDSISHADSVLNSITEGIQASSSSRNYSDNFLPNHSDLLGITDDDAHPQYLLKSGGEITGNITLADGVRIDGIIFKEHKHSGTDGSARISGSDIDTNSITDEIIDTTNSSTSIPENLLLESQVATLIPPGITKITAEVSFDVETASNITAYEFEIIKL